jgi:hypothetical protein
VLALWEALIAAKPDHLAGVSALVTLHDSVEQQARWTVRRAAILTTSFDANFAAARALIRAEDITAASAFLQRLEGLAASKQFPRRPSQLATLHIAVAWVRHDVATVRRLADDIASRPEDLSPPGPAVNLAQQLVFTYAALGRFRDAFNVLQQLPPDGDVGNAGQRNTMTARLLWERAYLGDQVSLAALRAQLERMYPLQATRPPNAGGASALATAGMVDELRETVARARQLNVPESEQSGIEGHLALAEGRVADAMRLLTRPGPVFMNQDRVLARDTARALAKGWEATGNLAQAAKILEAETGLGLSRCATDFSGMPFWIFARDRLARLYRGMGRTEDAEPIEAELQTLLALADGDHPVRVRLAAIAASH